VTPPFSNRSFVTTKNFTIESFFSSAPFSTPSVTPLWTFPSPREQAHPTFGPGRVHLLPSLPRPPEVKKIQTGRCLVLRAIPKIPSPIGRADLRSGVFSLELESLPPEGASTTPSLDVSWLAKSYIPPSPPPRTFPLPAKRSLPREEERKFFPPKVTPLLRYHQVVFVSRRSLPLKTPFFLLDQKVSSFAWVTVCPVSCWK